jgi:hypothetical protein
MKRVVEGPAVIGVGEGMIAEYSIVKDRRAAKTQRRARGLGADGFFRRSARNGAVYGRRWSDEIAHTERRAQPTTRDRTRSNPLGLWYGRRAGEDTRVHYAIRTQERRNAGLPLRRKGDERRNRFTQYVKSPDVRIRMLERRRKS